MNLLATPPKCIFLKSRMRLLSVLGLISLMTITVVAWVFPEHRDIALLGLQHLDAAQSGVLNKLWAEARMGHESRLCAEMADAAQAANPTCVDYAAWTAIAGDHSCSARDMLGIILDSPWILKVAGVSAQLKTRLAVATRRDKRTNAVRSSDFALLRADPDYVTRAGSNNAHFLLARSDVNMAPDAYGQLALGANADINALATYLWYHLRALAEADRIARGGVSSDIYPQVARAILADEAFALHFLEDSFSSGHVAGTWGNSAVRKGTHDYYSEHGLEVVTWDHHRFVAMGDAYMQPADAERAANAVRDSLAQLVNALDGKIQLSQQPDSQHTQPDGFDVCHQTHFPTGAGQLEDLRLVVPIITQTPVPALAAGQGELPRFRSELGAFVGLSTGVYGAAVGGGFGSTQSGVNPGGGLDAAFRLGVGLEGVLNESSDGLTFLDLGIRQDSATHGSSGIPGRSAIALRWRAPFWLVPGDLILAAPILAFTSPQKLQKMAVQSANGGLIPWQAGVATRVGRFQFVLGREIGLSLYGYAADQNILIPTPNVPPINVTEIRMRSLRVDLPVLEWRLFRTFSLNQSSGLAIQFYSAFDTPTSSSVVQPAGTARPNLHTVVSGGVRVVFDWRHYLR